jgi:hypothetical protein
MKKIPLAGLVFLFFYAIAIQPQTGTGLVSGTVSDPQYAVLVNARVRALEINTQSARVTTTNDVGFYSFSQLQPGDYEFSVEVPGFARFVSRVRVSVGTLTTVDAVLSLAQLDTNTTVIGDGGVQVETQTPMLSEVVNSQQITQSLTLTRNPVVRGAPTRLPPACGRPARASAPRASVVLDPPAPRPTRRFHFSTSLSRRTPAPAIPRARVRTLARTLTF